MVMEYFTTYQIMNKTDQQQMLYEAKQFESQLKQQAEINIKVMIRQCGVGYDNAGNPILDKHLLQEWFQKGLQQKDYTLYDTI